MGMRVGMRMSVGMRVRMGMRMGMGVGVGARMGMPMPMLTVSSSPKGAKRAAACWSVMFSGTLAT